MRRYVRLYEDVQGEYWLIDGQPTYCDGDVCDANHETIVIESILSNHDLENDRINIDELFEIAGMVGEGKTNEEIATLDALKDYDDEEIDNLVESIKGITKEEWNALVGKTDPRDYGLKHFGWIRVHGNNVQTYEISDSILREIADGIGEIVGEGMEDEELEQEEFNIEVVRTGKFYQDVPWSVLSSGSSMSLRGNE